ncbi:solute carrier family 22 member 14 [Perognathus longimembris pacificus]|uniref:solute carrier family 22 member 14 n=1 Tax=Perognathus longimembris pacificus TaxID=214514 RepID=UPI0020184DD2|nr:solute carrier family 22 member 14 [Perognathus longimembris pacificus]
MDAERTLKPDPLPPFFKKPSWGSSSAASHSWSLEMLLRRLRSTGDRQEDNFARVLDEIGEFGRFQWWLTAFTFLPTVLMAFFMFVDHFSLLEQLPYCNTSWILAVGPNLTVDQQLNLTLPRAPNGSFLRCLMYVPVPWDLQSIIQFGLNHTDICLDGWIYPDSKMRSLVNEFDLVCDKQPNKELLQAILMAGILTGSFIFGFICDKLGRHPTILLSFLCLAIFGFGTAFVSSFHQYLLFRFAVSQAVVGYIIGSLCLATEWLEGEHRTHAIILAHCFITVGILFLAGLAYSIPHWRLLFLVGGVPIFSLLSCIWFLPESPRWLMTRGKIEEAKKVLCYVARVNKKTIPPELLNELQLSGKKTTKASVLDFYTNRPLYTVILVMGCVWFSVSYSLHTLGVKLMGLDGVTNQFHKVVPGFVGVPARLSGIFLLEQFGRKWTLAVTLLQATALYLLLLFIPPEMKSVTILVVVFGHFSLSTTVSVFFIYTAELFPTVLRATGLGLMIAAWAAGAITSLIITSQVKSLLPLFLCCVFSSMALCFSSALPETQDLPLWDTLDHLTKSGFQKEAPQYSNESTRRNKEDTAIVAPKDLRSDYLSKEAAKNTILNVQNLKMSSLLPPDNPLVPLKKSASQEPSTTASEQPGQEEEPSTAR